MTAIGLSRIHFPVTTLGPGQRVGVWFQGCSIRCEGCISPDTWDASQGATSLTEVTNSFSKWAHMSDGLTVSGGEPLDQPEALQSLLGAWRGLSATSILLFTGRDWDELPNWLTAGTLVDAIMAGPFLKDQPQTRALRGSDNQTLHTLTQIGRAEFGGFERDASSCDRRLDIMFDQNGGLWFAGIPARGDFDRLRKALRRAGAEVVSTERVVTP